MVYNFSLLVPRYLCIVWEFDLTYQTVEIVLSEIMKVQEREGSIVSIESIQT